MNNIAIFFLIFNFIIFPVTIFAQQYPDIKLDQILSTEEQKAIGIDKLTEKEKENLRIIVLENILQAYQEGRKKGIEEAAESESSTPEVIESRIDGEFEGCGICQ